MSESRIKADQLQPAPYPAEGLVVPVTRGGGASSGPVRFVRPDRCLFQRRPSGLRADTPPQSFGDLLGRQGLGPVGHVLPGGIEQVGERAVPDPISAVCIILTRREDVEGHLGGIDLGTAASQPSEATPG